MYNRFLQARAAPQEPGLPPPPPRPGGLNLPGKMETGDLILILILGRIRGLLVVIIVLRRLRRLLRRFRRFGRCLRLHHVDAHFFCVLSEFGRHLHGEVIDPHRFTREGEGRAASDDSSVAEPADLRRGGQIVKTRRNRQAFSEFDRKDVSIGQGDGRGQPFLHPLRTPACSEERHYNENV